MAASVRIEDEAFSDVRFEVLATLCQLADADHARGKMAKLWRQCTAQGSYVLNESVVRAVLGADGATSLTESGLGEQVESGIRIKGTRGRIEWLKKLRNNARKGGKAKAAKRQTQGRQLEDASLPPPFPPAPAPAPITVPTHTETIVVSGSRPPKASRAVSMPLGWAPSSKHAELANSVGSDLAAEALNFTDHHTAKASRFADWDAAFRTWLRNSQRFRGAQQTFKTGRVEPKGSEAFTDGEVSL